VASSPLSLSQLAETMTPTTQKRTQLKTLQALLPQEAEVAELLRLWKVVEARYFGGRLRPCWLQVGIQPYGKSLGHWDPSSRTIQLASLLWKGDPRLVAGVLLHEVCHQAQSELFRELDQARGPRGKWTDLSHRCPAWSRAVNTVMELDGLQLFCPVWHRSTGNHWFPWVPAEADWRRWERADPQATVDGKRLLSLQESRSFIGGELTLEQLVEDLGLPTEENGKPVEWSL